MIRRLIRRLFALLPARAVHLDHRLVASAMRHADLTQRRLD